MKIIAFILALTPSFIHVNIRRMLGSKIGKGSKIKFGTLLTSKKILIGNNSSIGPFTRISSSELSVANNAKIKSLTSISTRIIEVGNYAHIAPLCIISSSHTERAIFKIGNHSRIFPFCWLEPGEGIYIGNHVGIGGHTLMFTHGVWPDYVDGGPVAYGPIKIEDNVWLPWRVFIMPNVTIGANAIIGANSTVNKSIPANALAAGSPAKIVKEDAIDVISSEDKTIRMLHVLSKYSEELNFKQNTNFKVDEKSLNLVNLSLIVDDLSHAKNGDLLILTNRNHTAETINQLLASNISILLQTEKVIHISKNANWNEMNKFITFIRNYGIRLTIYR